MDQKRYNHPSSVPASGEAVNINTLIPALSTGIYVAMWNYMGWELPTAAGDEIVTPADLRLPWSSCWWRTIATYSIPMVAGLYGGRAKNGKYQIWGLDASDQNVGIVGDLTSADATEAQKADVANKLGRLGSRSESLDRFGGSLISAVLFPIS